MSGLGVPAEPILTIGHSTRRLDVFLEMLRVNSVDLLADVRTVPRSRHNPQFNRETLPAVLSDAGIGYRHLSGLGGLRRLRPDSANTGWRNLSFRGYADYMQSAEFERHLSELLALAGSARTALMCAEAVPWRCHRSLSADALCVRGIAVVHILSGRKRQDHVLTPWALVKGTHITYPP